MNTRIFYLTLILLTVFNTLNINIYGQTRNSWMNPLGSLKDVKKGEFSSSEAGFSIGLPKQTGGFNGTSGISYNWRLPEGYFIAGTLERSQDIENSADFRDETSKVIQAVYNEFQRDLFEQPVEPVKAEAKRIIYENHDGIEMRIELPKGLSVIRVFWVKNKAYKIGLMLFENQLKYEQEALKVFDTLKIFSNEDTEALIRKKVEEATPSPLPQTPVTPKLKSDAEDENLKGKVKTVFAESRYTEGKKAGSPMHKDSYDYFNESGNYVKRISYDDTTGNPYQIRVYGYIDGNRVEKAGFITYESNPPMMAMSSPAPKKIDPRYSMRFEYKYGENEKLKEVTAYSNDGEVWTRTVFSYKPNMVEETRYQDKGKVSTKSIDVLDAKGNVIVSTYFGPSNQDWDEKLIYTYNEFDEQGNWTKRTTKFYRKIRGVERAEWTAEEFRTITYY